MCTSRTYTNAAASSPDPDPEMCHVTVEFKLVGNGILTNGVIGWTVAWDRSFDSELEQTLEESVW